MARLGRSLCRLGAVPALLLCLLFCQSPALADEASAGVLPGCFAAPGDIPGGVTLLQRLLSVPAGWRLLDRCTTCPPDAARHRFLTPDNVVVAVESGIVTLVGADAGQYEGPLLAGLRWGEDLDDVSARLSDARWGRHPGWEMSEGLDRILLQCGGIDYRLDFDDRRQLRSVDLFADSGIEPKIEPCFGDLGGYPGDVPLDRPIDRLPPDWRPVGRCPSCPIGPDAAYVTPDRVRVEFWSGRAEVLKAAAADYRKALLGGLRWGMPRTDVRQVLERLAPHRHPPWTLGDEERSIYVMCQGVWYRFGFDDSAKLDEVWVSTDYFD